MTITAQDHGIGQTWSCQSNVELQGVCVCVCVCYTTGKRQFPEIMTYLDCVYIR